MEGIVINIRGLSPGWIHNKVVDQADSDGRGGVLCIELLLLNRGKIMIQCDFFTAIPGVVSDTVVEVLSVVIARCAFNNFIDASIISVSLDQDIEAYPKQLYRHRLRH